MATCLFRSALASQLEAFLQTRRAAGIQAVGVQKILLYLDRYLMSELELGGTITREIAERWISNLAHLSIGTRINRISILRQFCSYLAYFDPRTCVIHRAFHPSRSRPAPHIYSTGEIRKIVATAKRLGPPGTLRPAVISTLVGILYSTGLRISEALNLTIGDVDLEREVLVIRETKFKKSRYVPLSPSALTHLVAYLRQRDRAGLPIASTSPVFVSLSGAPLNQSGFSTAFLELARKIGIRGPKGQRGPRVHDLRHSFAVHRLLAWYRGGANLFSKLPLLATYLGHSTVTGTEAYLHATAELLDKVGERFHNHCSVPVIRRRPHAKG